MSIEGKAFHVLRQFDGAKNGFFLSTAIKNAGLNLSDKNGIKEYLISRNFIQRKNLLSIKFEITDEGSNAITGGYNYAREIPSTFSNEVLYPDDYISDNEDSNKKDKIFNFKSNFFRQFLFVIRAVIILLIAYTIWAIYEEQIVETVKSIINTYL